MTETEHISPMDRPHRYQDPMQRYGSVPGCYLNLASLSVHPYAELYGMTKWHFDNTTMKISSRKSKILGTCSL